jgi:hypothetical protein
MSFFRHCSFGLFICLSFFAHQLLAMDNYEMQISRVSAKNFALYPEGGLKKIRLLGLSTFGQEPFIYGTFQRSDYSFAFINIILRDFPFAKMIIFSCQAPNGIDYPLFIDKNSIVHAVVLHKNKYNIIRCSDFANVKKIGAQSNRLVALKNNGDVLISYDNLAQNLASNQKPGVHKSLKVNAIDFWLRSGTLVYLDQNSNINIVKLDDDIETNKIHKLTLNNIKYLDIAYAKQFEFIELSSLMYDSEDYRIQTISQTHSTTTSCNNIIEHGNKIKSFKYCDETSFMKYHFDFIYGPNNAVATITDKTLYCITESGVEHHDDGTILLTLNSETNDIIAIHNDNQKRYFLILTKDGKLAVQHKNSLIDSLDIRGSISQNNYEQLSYIEKKTIFLMFLVRHRLKNKINIPKIVMFLIINKMFS